MRRHLVSETELKMDSRSPLQLSYGFIMDGVQPLRNITKIALGMDAVTRGRRMDEYGMISRPKDRKVRRPGIASAIPKYLAVYPDPVLDSFAAVKRFYFTRNEYLNLNVSLINKFC